MKIIFRSCLSLCLLGEAFAMGQNGGAPGEELVLKAMIHAADGMGYYLTNWGDGILSASALRNGDAPATSRHRWSTEGTYQTTFTRQSLSGARKGQKGPSVTILGAPFEPTRLKGAVRFSSGSEEKSVWTSTRGKERLREEWAEFRLEEHAPIAALQIGSKAGLRFPTAFRIEYSLDGGTSWLRVPTATFFNFPSPEGLTVEIPLHDLMANAVRIVVPIMNGDDDAGWDIQLGPLSLLKGETGIFSWQGNLTPQESAAWNNLWTLYGTAKSEVLVDDDTWRQSPRPLEGGVAAFASAEWMNWNVLKLGFLPDAEQHRRLRKALGDMVIAEDGFVWASPSDPRHLSHARHYTTNASFVSAVADYYLLGRDMAFLMDGAEPLLSKARRAMNYQLDNLHGREGILTIPDPENDGTVKGLPDNYWDFWRFGYQTSYGNILFYRSLLRMAELEKALGETERATELLQLAAHVKARFNEVFWNDEKGRYIGCIDVNGTPRDFGFTFINLLAVAEGIATEERARYIMDWMDGTVVHQTEDSSGRDIYHYKIAPRSNTIDAAHGEPWYESWNGVLLAGPGKAAEYGVQMQNGGAIFYVSFYDLIARCRVFGADNAWKRMQVILSEFLVDQLRRDPTGNEGMTEVVGVIGEFPESGLVPASLLYAWLGMDAVASGLQFTPKLPEGWKQVTVREFTFAGKTGTLVIDRGISAPRIETMGSRFNAYLPASGRHILTPQLEVK